jgi:hypothetical protein
MSAMTGKSLKGRVVRLPYAVGSKSEHEAVCLKGPKGRSYRLRLLDGEPFEDPRLNDLVGKSISAMGEIVHGNTMIVWQWTELEDQANAG